MKKKNIKKLDLNKKSISKLNKIQMESIKGASLWYCDSEGLGCILETRCGNGFCTGSTSLQCPPQTGDCTDKCDLIDPDPDHTRGCPTYNVAC